MRRLFSELNYYRARRAEKDQAKVLLANSLAKVPTNANASALWLKTMSHDVLADQSETTQAALFNTLMLGLRTLRNQALAQDDKNDFAFEWFVADQAINSHAQMFQDLWALFETDMKRGGYFVEFGATDGREISNTYLLEKDYGWQGILAEPNPVWHDALRTNRAVACLLYTSPSPRDRG